MTPLDRVPDQRPVPAGTGLTLEDALPAPVTAEADGVSARPRLARTVAEMRSALRELVAHATDDGDAEPVTVGLIPTMGALHGARLALHAALELDRRDGGRAAVSLCGGGGQGEALILFR